MSDVGAPGRLPACRTPARRQAERTPTAVKIRLMTDLRDR
jgi:hypothetical protein